MYDRVTRYFQDRGYGFILGKDKKTYYIHQSNLCGEHVERGYQWTSSRSRTGGATTMPGMSS